MSAASQPAHSAAAPRLSNPSPVSRQTTGTRQVDSGRSAKAQCSPPAVAAVPLAAPAMHAGGRPDRSAASRTFANLVPCSMHATGLLPARSFLGGMSQLRPPPLGVFPIRQSATSRASQPAHVAASAGEGNSMPDSRQMTGTRQASGGWSDHAQWYPAAVTVLPDSWSLIAAGSQSARRAASLTSANSSPVSMQIIGLAWLVLLPASANIEPPPFFSLIVLCRLRRYQVPNLHRDSLQNEGGEGC